ncbi:pseudouridine kinase isoform X2 [Malania oleifera]|uniref:pseudouridine kinase isoform X2 n=1 Tax=Malania oleifera TaxID=397392 RepID=UPI0025AE7217|nr:pseudouridine kinase isoform X2 [Malania oleifera]
MAVLQGSKVYRDRGGRRRRNMESSGRRQRDTLSRRLSPPPEADHFLHPEEAEPVIVGGMVLDIHATPSMPANPGTTTPGKVHYVLGGVARNVAECMSKLGAKPFMLSAVGLDMAGNLLLEHWKSAKLSIEGIQMRHDIETAVVCNIFDAEGELAAAVASVEAVEKFLTAEWIKKFKSKLSTAPVLMVDANLNPPALEASCLKAAKSDVPVWFEPVSVTKSSRVAPVVKYITFASPNEDELVAMANALSCDNVFCLIRKDDYRNFSTESLFQLLKPAIWVLLEKGIKIVLVTVGSNGVYLCSKGVSALMKSGSKRTYCGGLGRQLYKLVSASCPPNQFSSAVESEGSSHLFAVHFPALTASVVKLTGAGDCLVGGTLASICAGLDVLQSVAVGIAAAKAAVQAVANVPAEYSLATIADDAGVVYSAAKVLCLQSKL